MSAPENRPARAMTREQIIDLCNTSLVAYGARSHTDLTEDLTVAMRVDAQQLAVIYRTATELTAAKIALLGNTPLGAEEALEIVTAALHRIAGCLRQIDARLDLSDPPENVVLFAAHRVEIVGGRL